MGFNTNWDGRRITRWDKLRLKFAIFILPSWVSDLKIGK